MVSPHSASSLNLGASMPRAAEPALETSTWQRLLDDPATLADDELDRLLAAFHADPAVRQDWLAHSLVQEALQGEVHAPITSSAAFLHEFQQRRDILPLAGAPVRAPSAQATRPSLGLRLRDRWHRLQLARGRYTWPVLSAVTACALTVLAMPALQRNADLVPWSSTPPVVVAPAPVAAVPTAEAAAPADSEATPATDAAPSDAVSPVANAVTSDLSPVDASLPTEDALSEDLRALQPGSGSGAASLPRYGRPMGTPGWSAGSLSNAGSVGQGFRWQHGTAGAGLTASETPASSVFSTPPPAAGQ